MKCKLCLKDFKKKDKSTRLYCYECSPYGLSVTERKTFVRKMMKKEAVSLFGGQCTVCGYSKSQRALEFHHVDPSKKEYQINFAKHGWSKSLKELRKCALVCGNCHSEIHDDLIDLKIPDNYYDILDDTSNQLLKIEEEERLRNICQCGNHKKISERVFAF